MAIDRDADMYLAHQALRSPECMSYCEYVADICGFEKFLSDSTVQAGWERFGWSLRMLQATPNGFSETMPYVMNSSLPRWPDRFLWQAVPEAGAYDASLLAFTRRHDRGGLWSWYVIPAPACLWDPLGRPIAGSLGYGTGGWP